MPIKTFAKLEEVPEAQRTDAIETKDGKFILAEDPDTSDLDTQLATEKEKREAAEKLVRKTSGELQKLQAKKKADDAGLTEERLKEIQADALAIVRAELQPQLEEAVKLKAQNRALVLDADMKARALKAGILPAKIDDFWKLRGGDFDLTADGKPMVKDKPTLDPDKHLEALKKLNPEWVAGTKASGSGSQSGTATGSSSGLTAEEVLKNPARAFETA